jgi:hypothetical protein
MRFKGIKTFLFNMMEPQKELKWYSWIYHIFMGLVVLGSSGIVIFDLIVDVGFSI